MRALVVLLLLSLAVLIARPASAEDRAATARIQEEIAALASFTALAGGAETAFVGSESSVNFIRGHAWILSLWIEDAPAYGGTYFILSEIDGRLTGELLRGPGPEGMTSMVGEALTSFLARVELDAAPIRAAFKRYYRDRR